MNFELLPNETILDIFDFIDSTDLLRIFYGLNTRFNDLLSKQYRGYCFNLVDCSKETFDMVCQQYLPSISKQVSYLRLGNFRQSSGRIDLVLKYIPSINSFTYLRVLKFYKLCSDSILIQMINQFRYLINLIYLGFHLCHSQCKQVNIESIINKIWNLPKLIYLDLDIQFHKVRSLILPTKLSTSIQYLHLYEYDFTYNDIKQLFQYTPSLKQLKICLDLHAYDNSQSYRFLPLTYLQISTLHRTDTSKIISFIRNLSNLRQLDVCLVGNTIDGYQWEQLIENYLPRLKEIKLLMMELCPAGQNIHEHADRLLNSFRSSFWLDKHKWFVRCIVYEDKIHFLTLSATFPYFQSRFPCSWKSTDPNDDDQKYFNTITKLDYPYESNLSPLCLTNLHKLTMHFPIPEQFWSTIPALKQLKSLSISSYDDCFQSHLQTLLDHACNLTELSIDRLEMSSVQGSLFKCTSPSVRNLDLLDYKKPFDEEECLALIHSSLGIQCEILSVEIKSYQSIITLIQNMINLKVLYVRYKKKFFRKQLSRNRNLNLNRYPTKMNEVIQWLKEHLPSTCFISEYSKSTSSIEIWIE